MKEKLQGVDPITNGEDHTNEGASTKSLGDPAQSETPRTSRNIMHENRETWIASAVQSGGRAVGKGESRTAHRQAVQGSDLGVVPMNEGFEQGRETDCGEPGGKAWDQGERQSVLHSTDTERSTNVPGAGGRASIGKGEQAGEVHRTAASSNHKSVEVDPIGWTEKQASLDGGAV